MTEQNGDAPATTVTAGPAGAAGALVPQQVPFAGYAETLDDSAAEEFGVRFTSDYEPGTDYPPKPPPPAAEQHAMGLHAQARADEEAMRRRNPQMQGTEETGASG